MPPPPIPPKTDPSAAPPVLERRPAGAVATVFASGLPSIQVNGDGGKKEEDLSEQQPHGNPYDLTAATGSTVTASYPFSGDEKAQQLSFEVGDVVTVVRKEEMWSWGRLERGGKEGWFPHNYVGSTFKPLPGIHELAARLQKRREEQEAAARGDTGDESTTQDKSDADGEVKAGNTAVQGAGSNSTDGGLADNVQPDGSLVKEAQANCSIAGESQEAVDGGRAVKSKGGDGPDGTPLEASPDATSSGPPNEEPTPSKKSQMNLQTAAAPVLPPFAKGGASITHTTSAPEQTTNQVADEQIVPEVVPGAQIDGVGIAGTAPKANCRCSVM